MWSEPTTYNIPNKIIINRSRIKANLSHSLLICKLTKQMNQEKSLKSIFFKFLTIRVSISSSILFTTSSIQLTIASCVRNNSSPLKLSLSLLLTEYTPHRFFCIFWAALEKRIRFDRLLMSSTDLSKPRRFRKPLNSAYFWSSIFELRHVFSSATNSKRAMCLRKIFFIVSGILL